MDPTLSESNLDRRHFALAIGALAAGAALAPTSIRADEPEPIPAPKELPKPPTLAELNEQIIRQRFGAHLNDEQIKKLTQRFNGQRGVADTLKKFPLKNGDEPAFVFSAEN